MSGFFLGRAYFDRNNMELTPRQHREIAYHVQHAARVAERKEVLSNDVIQEPKRKWWNHYWVAYSILADAGLRGRMVLVPGCGGGVDAIRCAQMGAHVKAVDLSSDMLRVAESAAARAGVRADFSCMPAEDLDFDDNTFDVIFVRDLLHHCDVSACIAELVRVAKPGASVVIDELYTHTVLQKLRTSAVGRFLYKRVRRRIYHGEEPYITLDERKINQSEFEIARRALTNTRCRYFNTVVNRFVSDADSMEMIDRILTRSIGPAGRVLAGRVLVSGQVAKIGQGMRRNIGW
jgi:2-polyprenyl-3-methyl-5-hydroxy-6-metoxy-1,4-benzoquinol methylase